MEPDQMIDNIYLLSSKAKNRIKESVLEVVFPKGHILFRANKIKGNIYFIKKGIAETQVRS